MDTRRNPAPGPPIAEQPGDVIGSYELLEHVAEGGMGSVWRAQQHHPVEREVAIKIIRLGMNTRDVVSRFELERRTLARMDHPNIAAVFEAGATSEGRPYFAMELVNGEPVVRFCEIRKLPLATRLHLFMQACAAVEHAHRKGVIHRDIKPSNVLALEGPDGIRLKVIDFGIAKAITTDGDGQTFCTLAGHIVGTPGYMSPEQAGAEPDVDTRSDVYSLGAILYEMVTGSAPFKPETQRDGSVLEMMRKIRETDPVKPSIRRAETLAKMGRSPAPSIERIERDLDRIIMKALARERERRYSSASDLSEDLRRFLHHEPVSAAAPTFAYVLGKFVRKHRWPVALFVGLMLSIAASSLLIARESHRARLAAVRELAARKEAVETLSDSYRETGLHEAGNQRDGLAWLWFERAATVAEHDSQKSTANAHRAALHSTLLPLPVAYIHAPSFHDFASYRIHSNNRFVIEADWPPKARIFSLENLGPLSLEGQSAIVKAACFLRGTARVAVANGSHTIDIHDLETGSRIDRFELPGEAVTALWCSDDGTLLLAGGDHVSVHETTTFTLVRGPFPHPSPVKYARFDPTGRWLLTIDDSSDLRVFSLVDDSNTPLFPPLRHTEIMRTEAVNPPRFINDRIAGNFDHRFCFIHPDTGERLGGLDKTALDVTPDGALALLYDRVVELPSGRIVFRRQMDVAKFLPDGTGVYVQELGEILDLSGSSIGSIPLPRLSPTFATRG